jgi:hypothetical protein
MNGFDIKTVRVRILCDFLNRGGGTLDAMHQYINERLAFSNLDSIQLRTLQTTIELLRKGDFMHSKMHARNCSKLFKVQVISKQYAWHPESQRPQFGDLENNERFTLPLLSGILKRYERIPAVQKILDKLPEIFNINASEMQAASLVYIHGPRLALLNDNAYEDKIIQLAVTILEYIHNQKQIEFAYLPVNAGAASIKEIILHRVAPMQIRYYEYYYYLIAVDIEKKRVVNFRLDQIHKLKVEPYLNDENQIQYFDIKILEQTYRIKDLYKNVVGVWTYNEAIPVYEIKIEFTDWAASYVRKLILHPTQRLIYDKPENKTLCIALHLKLEPEKNKGQPVTERSAELAFLLGRFRSYAKVLSAVETF